MTTKIHTDLSEVLPSEFWDRRALDILHPNLVLEPLGKRFPLPDHQGKIAKFYRFAPVTAPTSALVEGVVPKGNSLTCANVDVTVQQFGDYIKMSDWSQKILIPTVVKEAQEGLMKSAALLLDTFVRDHLVSALENQFADGGAAIGDVGTSTVLNAKEFLKASVKLEGLDVPYHSGGAYVAVIHPNLKYDLYNDTNVGSLNDVYKRGIDNPKIFKTEMGIVHNCRILTSSNMYSTTSGTSGGARAYSTPVLGDKAFATVSLAPANIKMYIKRAGSSGVADPIDQIAAVGYKIMGFAVQYLGGNAAGLDDGAADPAVQIWSGTQSS